MPRRPIVRAKTSAAVVDYVLEQIFDGSLHSGDRIDLDELCDALGVSRLPVREAMVMLERDGIVSTKYHRGVFVEDFDAGSILDDFEIMGMLSGLAVRRLAEKGDPEAITALRGLVADLRAEDGRDADRTLAIVQQIMTVEHRAGGSRRLRAQLRAHAGFLPHAFRFASGRSHEVTVKAHARVLKAVVAGDGDKAAQLRLEDFRDAGKRVVRELVARGIIERPT
jgi:DNA-binding GntR family transcriptional regulator